MLIHTRHPWQISSVERMHLDLVAQANADRLGIAYTAFFDTSGNVRLERQTTGPRRLNDDSVIKHYYPEGKIE